MKHYERIFVHPDFKKMLKKEAVDKEKSLFELTEDLARDNEALSKRIKNAKSEYRI